MKAKLIKKDGHYFLEVEPNTWTPPNKFHSIIANTLEKTKGDILEVSLKNCQAIERGYYLDELADENVSDIHEANTDFMFKDIYREYFKEGFQKALELMGDKKFSEEDMKSFAQNYYREIRENTSNLLWNQLADKCLEEHIQSLQQTEWDVEVEMEFVGRGKHGIGSEVNHYMPKKDADGCLILKRV